MKAYKEKEVIKTIHYKEAKDFLEFMEAHEKLEREIVCHICGAKITAGSFKAMTRRSEKLLFCCDNLECYRTFIETLRG